MKTLMKKHLGVVFIISIFLFLIGFNCILHPMYIYSVDDWTYIGVTRTALPQIDAWNPIKVLPEIMMPFFARIGVYFISPIVSGGEIPDYINGMAISYGLIYSLIWTIYFGLIYKMLKILMTDKKGGPIFATLAILIAHFAVFNDKTYLFWTWSATSVFNYTIPLLLNAFIILISECIINKKNQEDCRIFISQNYYKMGFLILLGYMCIFSNIVDSIVSASYFGVLVLLRVLKIKKINKEEIIKFFKDTYLYIAYVLAWFVSALMELGGARADSLEVKNSNFIETTMNGFVRIISHFRIRALLVIFLLFVAVFFIIINRKKEQYVQSFKGIIKMILVMGITVLFYVLLGARAGAEYMETGILSGSMLPLVIIAIYIFSLVLNKMKIIAIFMPLMIVISSFSTLFYNEYADYNYISPQNIYEFDNYIIDSALEADNSGVTDIEILVPICLSEDNFPLAVTYGGDRISNALYELGITSNHINITLIADEKINNQFNIKIK